MRRLGKLAYEMRLALLVGGVAVLLLFGHIWAPWLVRMVTP